MGSVWLARTVGEGGFERLVVVKRMHAYLADDPLAVARFLDEAKIAAHIHHANVAGIQHVGSDDGGYFLVLDYVEGDSLEGLLARATKRGQPLPIPVAIRILLDAALGLDAVHGAEDVSGRPLGVLHRDVSTSNLLVGKDGVTRLSDFGIARSMQRTQATKPGRIVGKPMYLSPECLRGDAVDVRMDVYALGICAFAALGGGDPWPGAGDGQILVAALAKGVPPLLSRVPELAPAVARVVDAAVVANPDRRLPDARAFHDALAAAAKEVGVASHAEVAGVVERLVGEELAARRRTIARRSNEEIVSSRDPSAVALEETHDEDPPKPPEARAGRGAQLMGIGLGIVVALVVALVVFRIGATRPNDVSTAVASSSAPAIASSAPSTAAAPSARPSSSALPEPSATERGRPISRPPSARPRSGGISTANPYR